VAEALGKTGDARAIEPLRQALKDKNGDVQKAAKEALEKIGASPSAKIICPQCASEMEPGKKFCTKCGTKLSG
jgi:HEAT repeat protein